MTKNVFIKIKRMFETNNLIVERIVFYDEEKYPTIYKPEVFDWTVNDLWIISKEDKVSNLDRRFIKAIILVDQGGNYCRTRTRLLYANV